MTTKLKIKFIKWHLVLCVLGAIFYLGCAEEKLTPEEKMKREGRVLYISNCASCHNDDPSQSGSLGPAIKGSSLELLRARILKASYPPGYAPKRKTKMMSPISLSAEQIRKIYAFLR